MIQWSPFPSVGTVLALIALVICIVLAVMGSREPMLGLVALLAMARLVA